MIPNLTDDRTDTTSRRLFMQLAAATGVAAGIGTAASAQESTIELDGDDDGWIGRSPEEIADERNPTIELIPGETYTLTWTNVDGSPHNVVIIDEGGNQIERTEIIDGEGASQTLEFEATEEMSEYFCEVHPDDMRGQIVTGDGDGDEEEADQEEPDDSIPISEAFSAGTLSGKGSPEAIDTAASGASLFGLDEECDALHYILLVAEIEDVTQAHIHLGGPDEDGDIGAWLFGQRDEEGEFVDSLEQGVSGSGVLATGEIAEGDLVGPLEGESLEGLLDRLRDESVYVNVHTREHPGGEIRGQIGPADAASVTLKEHITVSAEETLRTETHVTLDVSDGGGGEADAGGADETDDEGDNVAGEDDGVEVETEGDIDIAYGGTVASGNEVTITATVDGEPVTDADVYVEDGDGDRQLVGQTDGNGQLAVTVPETGDDAGELDIQVRKGEREGELEVKDDD